MYPTTNPADDDVDAILTEAELDDGDAEETALENLLREPEEPNPYHGTYSED